MKQIFTAFSQYNQKTNKIIFDYIRQMSYTEISSQIHAYYKAIGDTISHVMASDLKWLDRLSRFYDSGIDKDCLKIFMENDRINLKNITDKIDDFYMLRLNMDNAIINLIDSIPGEKFSEEIEIPWGKGSIKKEIWKLLLQWFNHHTHHRGQVSIQLDNLGIDNDYTMVLDKIEQEKNHEL
ncbi:MAG: hypothetical protein JW969_01435 [Spirochaetales bacterium]|nr:hypothetical protein [Spirochaetales bacterium]